MYIIRSFSRLFMLATVIAFAAFLFMHRAAVDSRGPVIQVEDKLIEVSVEDGDARLLEGVTASDSSDGDVTESVAVENISTFFGDGKRLVTYVAFDSDMHVGRATRELKYTDYEPPRFIIDEPLQYYPGAVNLKISAMDCLDGDISSAIKLVVKDAITSDQPGEYQATFQVANSAGDVSSLPVTIEIVENTNQAVPSLNLKTYLAYIPKGSDFDPYSYLETVTIGNREYKVVNGAGNYGSEEIGPDEETVIGTDMVPVKGSVDTETPGTYKVRYSITIDMGHNNILHGHTVLYVVVR